MYCFVDVLVNELGLMDLDVFFIVILVKELGLIDLGSGLEVIGFGIFDVWFRGLELVKLDSCLEGCVVG